MRDDKCRCGTTKVWTAWRRERPFGGKAIERRFLWCPSCMERFSKSEEREANRYHRRPAV